MSKKTKTKAAQKRKAEKAKRKAANVAKYQAWRDAGQNPKRAQRNAKCAGPSPNKHLHLIANCGNAGCKKCFPRKGKK